jgi:hypothetical protein
MRDLTRRLSALEARRSKCGYRHVVIVGPGDSSPPDGDSIHIIRIVAVNPTGEAVLALPHNGREPLSEFMK